MAQGKTYCSKHNERRVVCPRCKGKGTIYHDYILHGREEQCPNCKGKGEVCPKCGE